MKCLSTRHRLQTGCNHLSSAHVRAFVQRARSTGSGSNSSSSTDITTPTQLGSWQGTGSTQQQPAAQLAAASGTAIAFAAIAPSAYHVLSSAALPPISVVLEVLVSCFMGVMGVAKVIHGDNVHLELHKGRLYVQLGVPKSGPALLPGSITTQPTGDVRGNGAFATCLIPAGTHIANYWGELLSNKAFFNKYPDGVGDYVMAIDRDYVIDAAAWVDGTDSFHPVHMNHSRTRHNVVRYYNRARGQVSFFASRDIQPGEELLYDYGRAYWAGREHLELP